MYLITASILFFGVAFSTFAATFLVLRILRHYALFDHPNPRSSHASPTPRGGGIAILATLVPIWIMVGSNGVVPASELSVIVVSVLGLAGISWLDDIGGLSPLVRIAGQSAAVGASLFVMPPDSLFFAGILPPAVDVVVAGVLWVWFINLFNFMDGIDGIAGTETVCIGIGVAVVAMVAGLNSSISIYGLIIAAAALGFLGWNWQPAKIFMGDVGSVPLGYLLGWLLLVLAATGQPVAALILPLYYLADSTVTLVSRAIRGEKVWQAHRQHFYQRATQRGLSHARVVIYILIVNFALLALAVTAASASPVDALLGPLPGAFTVVAGLLYFLGRR